MKVIMVKGFSKTGKTTTTEALIKELSRRGYTVGTVKDIHAEGFTMEQAGTDTHRHKQAGAEPVTARGRNETNITFHGALDINKILDRYTQDYVILEGDCGAYCPVILTGRTKEDLKQRWDDRAIAISGMIAAEIKEYKGRPAIDATKEVERLVNLVEEKTKNTPEETEGKKVKSAAKAEEALVVELRLNGEDIPLVPFVEKVISSVVEGLVKDLKGYQPGEDIEIKVKSRR